MGILVNFVFVFATCSSALAQAGVAPLKEWHASEAKDIPSKLNLIAWNVNGLPGRAADADEQRQRSHQQKVFDVLKVHRSSIVFLSEVRELQSIMASDFPHCACTSFRIHESEGHPFQQMALLSDIPWEKAWSLDFSGMPDLPDSPPRGVVGATFCFNSGQRLHFFGVHLKSNLGKQSYARLKRQKAVRLLIRHMQREGIDPAKDWVVVAGDFNTSPKHLAFAKEQTLRLLMANGFASSWGQMIPDTAMQKGDFAAMDFDHFFVSGAMKKALGAEAARIDVSEEISDHHPILLPLR